MQRPGGGCPELLKTLTGEMFSIAKTYAGDKVMKKQFGIEIDNVVKKIYEDVFDVPFEARSAVEYTKGRLRTFENRLWRVKKAIESDTLHSKFGSLFYAPSSLIKSNPQLGVLMDNLHNVNLEYSGRTSTHNRQFKEIIGYMKKQMIANNYNTSDLFPNMSTSKRMRKAVKVADRFDRNLEELSVKAASSNKKVDKDNLLLMMGKEEKFYTKGEGKVFFDMVKTIETTLPEIKDIAVERWQKSIKN